ncbi:hypothetical protein GCM10026982_56960 [Nocardiopsis aegyptia]
MVSNTSRHWNVVSVRTAPEDAYTRRDSPTYSYVTVTYVAVGLASPLAEALCWWRPTGRTTGAPPSRMM